LPIVAAIVLATTVPMTTTLTKAVARVHPLALSSARQHAQVGPADPRIARNR
jgi:hypothetical protein